jgi:hypothetical protein
VASWPPALAVVVTPAMHKATAIIFIIMLESKTCSRGEAQNRCYKTHCARRGGHLHSFTCPAFSSLYPNPSSLSLSLSLSLTRNHKDTEHTEAVGGLAVQC